MDGDSDIVNQLLQRIDKLENELAARDKLVADKQQEIERLKQTNNNTNTNVTPSNDTASTTTPPQQPKPQPAVPLPSTAFTNSLPAPLTTNTTTNTKHNRNDNDTEMNTNSTSNESHLANGVINHHQRLNDKNRDTSAGSDDRTQLMQSLLSMNEQLSLLESSKSSVDVQYMGAMNELIDNAEVEARGIWQRFHDSVKHQNESLRDIRTQLRERLKGEYIEVNADKLDQLILRDRAKAYAYDSISSNGRQYDSMSHTAMFSKRAAFHGWRSTNAPSYRSRWSATSARMHDSDDDDGMVDDGIHVQAVNSTVKLDSHTADTAFISSVEERRQRQREEHASAERKLNEEVRQRQKQQAIENRQEVAVTQILPLVPHLTLEQCISALKTHYDRVEQTIEWLLTTDLDAIMRELDHSQGNNTVPATSSSTSSDSTSHSLSLQRQYSSQLAKVVTFRVLNVDLNSSNTIVELDCVLDRNRVPIDTSARGATLNMPLHMLLALDCRVASNSEKICIGQDIQERTLQLVFTELDDNQFEPLQLQPAGLKITDYAVDFINSFGVRGITHIRDGPVLYNAQKYSGTNPLTHVLPVVLYTQVLDDLTVNIVHLHLDDLSDDISIDSVYLTEPDASLMSPAIADFKRDATGRKLQYKIVCQNQRVLGVLHPRNSHPSAASSNVQSIQFEERQVPAPNSYVKLPGNRIARVDVDSIPVGLLVTAQSDQSLLDKYEQQHQHSSVDAMHASCPHKHPVDLHGNLRVTVLMENNVALLQPQSFAFPLCRLEVIPAGHGTEKQIQIAYGVALNDAQQLLTTKVQQLENALQSLPSLPSAEQMSLLDTSRQEVITLSSAAALQEFVSPIKKRIQDVSSILDRRLRVAALDRRSGGQTR